jgi:Winged helix DNA-binding domain
MMRYTLHLVTARDLLWLRPALQPVLERAQRGFFGHSTAGMDLAELVAVGRALFEERPLTPVELRERLRERWPDRDARALAYSVRYLLPLVHLPPGGTWGQNGSFPYALPESWLGRPLESAPELSQLVLRYLAAFGPATVMDVQQWSGLTRLRTVVEGLRPQLRTFRSEAGKELFDLPDAPRPDPDTPAPPRFLPAYDNLMVAYVDRTRIMTDEHRNVLAGMGAGPGEIPATILVDGFVRGTWQIERRPGRATLVIEPLEPLAGQVRNMLREEGERLLRAFSDGAETFEIQWRSEGSALR